MKAILLFSLTFSLLAHASLISHDHGLISRRDHSQLARRAMSKRCRMRTSPNSSPAPAPPPPPTTPANNNNEPVAGVLTVQSAKCGPNGATKEPTATGGPNGREDWLNCGLFDEGGWHPPLLTMDQVVAMDLDQAMASPDSPFQKCAPYISLFKQYANQHGILPIMMVSFALQESSCNPETIGGAGEQGLMQLTQDKCDDAPGGYCRDPDYNIRTGTKFFADTLARNNGSVILSIGEYNGWYSGLTYAEATAAASTQCCRCQNNADYLQQHMNGWWQNKNVYGWPRIGTYFNLDICNK